MNILDPVDVDKINEMEQPNSPYDWAVFVEKHDNYGSRVAVGYGPVPEHPEDITKYCGPDSPGGILVFDNVDLERV